ncbi:hypothetical protein ABT237_09220 [Streptomyces sp. NPDC001581]|uniref:hypothetical protein n=1 Tax=Streptomyces sp. NPDC001581 TaxID=3154386 RepID=UPI0033236DA9
MAGMRIVVCLPGEARSRLDEAVAEAMSPFEIDYSRGEELDIWDGWWIRGGADGGGFQLLPGYEEDPRVVHDGPRGDGTREPSLPGRCAGGPREALAFAEIRAEAAGLARAAWDLWHGLAPHHPPAEPHREVSDRPWSTPDEFRAGRLAEQEAEAAFDAQPLVAAYREGVAALLAAHRGYELGGGFLYNGAAGAVGWTGREEFAAEETAWMPGHDHVLTLDGWWYGEDGPVHGACDGPGDCPHAPPLPEPYRCFTSGYLEALPGDTLLVHVRCHV